jgi:signal transduction histidine kinase
MAVDLKALTATLESRVAERTNDLQRSLDALKETQRRLVDASRQAGMAEVATSVLHNVGNVLNSVNVSANLVQSAVRSSRAAGIGKLADLIAAHGDDLAALAETPAGKRLPAYIANLAAALAAERRQIDDELMSLAKRIDHIKIIVSLQQSHAKVGGIVERLSLAKLVEDAIALRASSSEKHRIDVVRQLEDAEIDVDRHKLLQIITNLLSNAWHAVQDREGARRVTVRAHRRGGWVGIEIEDNGCGISPEALPKIFTHGFTTKRDGHGFGLHASACAAAELGGRLTVASDGIGLGATFAVLFPVALEGTSAAAA